MGHEEGRAGGKVTPDRGIHMGCGCDYRDGFTNVDASDHGQRVDVVLSFPKDSLLDVFVPGKSLSIVCNHMLEHLHRWEADALLREFALLLSHGGSLELSVPNVEWIAANMSGENLLRSLYGGQDAPYHGDSYATARRRTLNPELFVHRYGYTRDSLRESLVRAGLVNVEVIVEGRSLRATSEGPGYCGVGVADGAPQ